MSFVQWYIAVVHPSIASLIIANSLNPSSSFVGVVLFVENAYRVCSDNGEVLYLADYGQSYVLVIRKVCTQYQSST